METTRPQTAMKAALCVLACGASGWAAAADNPLTVQFSHCTEFVGLAPVDAVAARALVPLRYTPIVDAAGARLVVRVVDCQGVRVVPLPSRAGRVGQIGILIASPDGTATDPNTSINNYTLSYASDVPALVLGLVAQGIPAALDVGLSYEYTAPAGPTLSSELYAAVSPELNTSPTWFLHGSIRTPTLVQPFLANWWRSNRSGNGARQVKMSTNLPSIAFDFSSSVAFTTSRQNLVGKLLGANVGTFPLSFRGAFDAGTMVVNTAP